MIKLFFFVCFFVGYILGYSTKKMDYEVKKIKRKRKLKEHK